MVIKTLSSTDYHRVRKLISMNKHTYVHIPSDERIRLLIDNNLSIGIFENDQLIGFSLCFIPTKMPVYGNGLDYIINDLIMVDSSKAGQGFGLLILEELERLAIKEGISKIGATISPLNIASLKVALKSNWVIKHIKYKKYIDLDVEHNYTNDYYDEKPTSTELDIMRYWLEKMI